MRKYWRSQPHSNLYQYLSLWFIFLLQKLFSQETDALTNQMVDFKAQIWTYSRNEHFFSCAWYLAGKKFIVDTYENWWFLITWLAFLFLKIKYGERNHFDAGNSRTLHGALSWQEYRIVWGPYNMNSQIVKRSYICIYFRKRNTIILP